MNYELYDDKQIVDGILSNDKQLIGYFFNKKCSKLLSYIILNVFDGHVDQRALVSELYIYMEKNGWYKIRQFDFRSKLMTWLSVVAIRFFQKKREELIEKCSADAQNNKLQVEWHIPSLSIEQKMDIRAALQKMPNERYRKVIEVLDLQEVRPELLAEEMNITVDNLYNIHRRARVQLRLIMGRKEDYYD